MAILRYLGFGKETTYASGVIAGDTKFVDIASATLDSASGTEMVWNGGLGRAAQVRRPGFYSCTGNVIFPVELDTLPVILENVMGAVEFTDGPADIYEFYLTQSDVAPSTLKMLLGKDTFEHDFLGCSINSLNIDFGGDFVKATADVVANKDAKATIKDPEDITLSEFELLTFQNITLEINGTPYPCRVDALTLDLNNNFDPAKGKTIGSRYACNNISGEFTAEVGLTVLHKSTNTFLSSLWGGASGPADTGGTTMAVKISGQDRDGNLVTLSMPGAYLDSCNIQPSGRDTLVETIKFKTLSTNVTLADAVTVVNTPILITLIQL